MSALGDFAYLASLEYGLRVIDVSNLAAPVEVALHFTFGWAEGVEVVGDTAYVGNTSAGLTVIDVSTPSAPVEIGAFYATETRVDSSIDHLFVSGDFLYAIENGVFRVLDISDTSIVPVELGSIPGGADDVWVEDGLAYLVRWNYGLRVIDVSDPSAPFEVHWVDMPPYAEGVSAAGGIVYVADDDSGLLVYGTVAQARKANFPSRRPGHRSRATGSRRRRSGK